MNWRGKLVKMIEQGNRLYDVIIIGGGSAGMACALALVQKGVEDVLIIERSSGLGGVLRQCIHKGFGLLRFQQNLTGIEYADQYEALIGYSRVQVMLNTTVLSLTPRHEVLVCSPDGLARISARAIVLATGCRERPAGALHIAGERPAGIFTAGTAQKYLNVDGYLVGRKIVIAGTGDIGMIMARQFAIEKAEVICMVEQKPFIGGSLRNYTQCVLDYDIPVLFSSVITRIEGTQRICGVRVAETEGGRILPGTERLIACDTLVTSVGLIPENEIAVMAGAELDPVTGGPVVDDSFHTAAEGIFACGNALFVHNLVDQVSEEGEITGQYVAEYLRRPYASRDCYRVSCGAGIQYAVPQLIRKNQDQAIRLAVRPGVKMRKATLEVRDQSGVLAQKQYRGAAPGELMHLTIESRQVCGDLKADLK